MTRPRPDLPSRFAAGLVLCLTLCLLEWGSGRALCSVAAAQAETPPAATAQEPSGEAVAEARRLFRAGARSYDAGRFGVAVQAFDQAYELAPRIAIRFSAAQALRRLFAIDPRPEHLHKALRYYRQYLNEVGQGRRVKDAAEAVNELEVIVARLQPRDAIAGVEQASGIGTAASAEGGERAAELGTLQLAASVPGARARIEGLSDLESLPSWIDLQPGDYRVAIEVAGYQTYERRVRVMAGRVTVVDAALQERPAQLVIHGEREAEVLIDGRPVGQAILGAPLELDSGVHRVAIGRSGHRVHVEDLRLSPGEERALQVELDMTPQRLTAWLLIGGAATLAVGGVVLQAIAAGYQTEADNIENRRDEEARDLTPAEARRHNAKLETATDLRNGAVIGWGAAALAAGVGLAFYLLDEPQLYNPAPAAAHGEVRAPSPAPSPAPSGPPSDRDPLELSASPIASPGDGPAASGLRIGCALAGRF